MSAIHIEYIGDAVEELKSDHDEHKQTFPVEMEIFRVTIPHLSFIFYTPVRHDQHTLYSNVYFHSNDVYVNYSPYERMNAGITPITVYHDAQPTFTPGLLLDGLVPPHLFPSLQEQLDELWIRNIVPDHILHDINQLYLLP